MTTTIVMIVSALLFVCFAFICDEREGWAALMLLIFCGSAITSYSNSESYKESKRQEAEAAQRESIPHVIREADGCKVYAFTTDREHYFTRCGSSVTTETTWKKSCGKNCSRVEGDTIVTEGNK